MAVAVYQANLEAVQVLHAAGADMVNPKVRGARQCYHPR